MHKTEAFRPFRALQSAWEILMKAPLPLWVGGLVLVVVENLGSGGGNFSSGNEEHFEEMVWLLLPLAGLGCGLMLVALAVSSWLKIGYYKGIEGVMREGQVQFDRLYKKQATWMNVFLVHIFQLVLWIAAVLPFFLCVILSLAIGHGVGLEDGQVAALAFLVCLFYFPVFVYITLGFSLMPFAAALDSMGPMAALSHSWSLARGIRLPMFLMGLLSLGMILLGLCVFCVGSLAGMILSHVMWCEAYIQATRDDMGQWWINDRNVAPQGGADDGWPEAETRPDAPRDVEAQTPEPESAPADEGADEETAFDPSAWRKGSDIPPIEEDPA
jgi:hypothetical protein